MDDYFNPEIAVILLIVLAIVQNAVSNFKMSFDLLNENVIFDDLKDSHQSKIEKLLYSRDRIIITVIHASIILSTLIVILCGYIAASFIENIYWAALAAFAGAAVLLSVITYIIPTAACKKAKFKAIIRNTPFVNFFYYLLYPFVSLYLKMKPEGSVNIASTEDNTPISLEELSEAVEIVSKSTSPNDKKILTGLGWFVDAKISDIMTHRTDMVAKDISSSFKEIEEAFVESKYSRIPIYNGDIDVIEGVLYVKDIIEHIHVPDFKWQELIRKPIFIEDTALAKDLLAHFQECHGHLAIVTDEYGSTQGVVTLEDILEEIVGEIDDEADSDEEDDYIKVDDDTYIFEGKVSVNDFEHIMDIDEEVMGTIQGSAETLAGLFIELSQAFPRVGSEVEAIGFRFIIIGMNKNRISKIKVIRTGNNEPES